MITGITAVASPAPTVAPAIVFPRGFSPDFFSRQKAPAIDPAIDEAISFPQHEGETMAEFEQSSQFPLFVYEFMVHLDCIKRFADEHLGDAAHEISRAFDDFGRRLFDPEYAFFGEEKSILYGAGMRSLCQFTRMLTDSALNLPQRKNSVLQLADGVQECAAGAAVNLADAASMLQSMLGGEFHRIRESVATALVIEFHQCLDVSKISPAYEIHSGTRLRNEMADTLGFKKIEDPLAEHCDYTPTEIEDCRQHVLQHFTPARLAMVLAEEYLEAFRQPIIETLNTEPLTEGQTAVNVSAPFDYLKFSAQLYTAKEPLKNYGDVNMHSLLTYTDENFSLARLNADPSLVALDILDGQRRNGTVTENYQATTLLKWRHRDKEICVMHHAGQIAWATENSESRLLRAKDLMLISPREFKGKEEVAKRIVANVITNETPEKLQACMSLAWLSIADTQQVFATWTPAAISRYLKRHSMQIVFLPRFRKLAVIKGIVAHGSLSDLALFGQSGLTLFAESIDKTRTLPAYFTIALLREDQGMLDALGTLLVSAAGKSIPLRTGNAMFTDVNARGASVLHSVLANKASNPVLLRFGEIAMDAALRQVMTFTEFEEILSAKNAHGTPGLLFAIRNNDASKIKDFGTILMNASKNRALDAGQAETLLRADNGGGTPGFYFAAINDCADAIIAYSSVVLTCHTEGFLTQRQASGLITGRTDEAPGTLLLCAVNYGNENAVISYGKVLLIAAEQRALTHADIGEVLGDGTISGALLLEAPVLRNDADTVAAFGDILLTFYKSGIVNRSQLCTILAGADPARSGLMMKSLTSNRDVATEALALIVFRADIIRRQTEGPASLLLSTPHRYEDALPAALAVAASIVELEAIGNGFRALRLLLQSGGNFSDEIKHQVVGLSKRMQKSCLGLFFCPQAVCRAKTELFAEIAFEWDVLAPLVRDALHQLTEIAAPHAIVESGR
jgi:hypothetical protein